MAQFAQRLGFDLTNAFARDVKHFANLFQSACAAVLQTETEL